jgi:predicted AAA+ superfamily ATPase
MNNNVRIYGHLLQKHPARKMLFLTGPRQVGKTTIAQDEVTCRPNQSLYFNYDVSADRNTILSDKVPVEIIRKGSLRPLVVFDEIHKMRLFKRWLKGFFDRYGAEMDIVVTGSGRLDLYQRGGDSLLGRYFLYHIHPLSLGELVWTPGNKIVSSIEDFWSLLCTDHQSSSINIERLLCYGGFPEPYLTNNEQFSNQWRSARKLRLLREDVRDLTQIRMIDRMEFLIDLLNPRIGSPLSINGLREDLDVAFESIRSWIAVLERLYYLYSLPPWSKKIARSITKERKVYFWDWSEVFDEAARFENMVVSHFLKSVDFWRDSGHGNYSLHYVRDKQKRETDILVAKDLKPVLLVEVKLTDRIPSKNLMEHARQLKVKNALQIILTPGIHDIHKLDNGLEVRVVSASQALALLV